MADECLRPADNVRNMHNWQRQASFQRHRSDAPRRLTHMLRRNPCRRGWTLAPPKPLEFTDAFGDYGALAARLVRD